MTFITAKEARKITDSVNEMGSSAVYDDINEALGTGIDHVYTSYPISKVTRKNLEEKGYKVEDMKQLAIMRDNRYHRISW